MSGTYADPDWANPGESTGGEVTESVPAASGNAAKQPTAGRDNSSAIQRLLSLVNLILCGGMIALSVLTLIQFRGMDLAEACLATYMIIFAALLALYELMWWFTIDVVNKSMRKNFGFLYGIKGKAGFMIFVAFLVIGLEFSLAWLRYTVGVAFLLDGLLHLFLHFSKPEVLGTYSAPTGGLANVV